MSNLSLQGMSSLHALNQWISVIDTNLTNTRRVGYKETRVSMTGGIPDSLGTVNSVGKPRNIEIPSATLNISNTEIMDKVQGNLTPTESLTDFALDGQGYFVVEDKFGRRFATRDGQFHFDNDGYLITQQGLKVLSAGQDWIRVPISEHFQVDGNGKSQSVQDINGLSTSLYGNKKLMVIKLPENKKLFYSQYGFTTFEIGNFLPINLNNNFDSTMDGLNPGQIKSLTNRLAGTFSTNEKLFKRDILNGTVVVDIANGKVAQAQVSSHKFVDFANQFSFKLNQSGGLPLPIVDEFSTIGFSFGLNDADLTSTAGRKGISAGLVNRGLLSELGIYDRNGATLAVLPFLTAGLSGSVSNILGNIKTDNNVEYTMSLIVDNGVAKLSLNSSSSTVTTNLLTGAIATVAGPNVNVGTVNFTLNQAQYSEGYQTIGSLNDGNLPVGTIGGLPVIPSNNTAKMTLTNLNVKQLGGSTYFDMNMVGTKRSNEFDPVGNKYNTQWDVVDPDTQENIDTQVRQQFVEESTTTVADTIPMLSNTQKMFSAISKIISIANSISDDVNGLVR